MVSDRPFELPGDDRGVLCIHGFTGTPYEMRFLGEDLHARGMTVVGIRLPGHGTRVEDLEPMQAEAWVAAVDDAYDRLAARCRAVAVVGQSMGGLLALGLAARRRPAAVAALATPLWLGRVSTWISRAAIGRVRWLPKLGGSDVRAGDARRANPSYRRIPTTALWQFVLTMANTIMVLDQVTAPLLVLHGARDHTAPVGSAARIAERTRARELRVRILPESQHLIAIDVERTIVAAEVGTWFARHLRAAP